MCGEHRQLKAGESSGVPIHVEASCSCRLTRFLEEPSCTTDRVYSETLVLLLSPITATTRPRRRRLTSAFIRTCSGVVMHPNQPGGVPPAPPDGPMSNHTELINWLEEGSSLVTLAFRFALRKCDIPWPRRFASLWTGRSLSIAYASHLILIAFKKNPAVVNDMSLRILAIGIKLPSCPPPPGPST